MNWGKSWGAAALVLLSVGAGAGAAQENAAPVSDTGAALQSAPVTGAAATAQPASDSAATTNIARRHGRLHGYVHDLIGPGALIGVAASAGIDQWQKSPPQWGNGASGFGKRVASRYGELFAQETVRDGLSAALGRDPEYHRCACTDFGGRLNHALVESITDINQSGHRVFSIPRVAGYFAGGYAPLLWRPDLTVSQATRDGALGFLFNAAGNLVTEYIHLGGGRNPPVVARRHRGE